VNPFVRSALKRLGITFIISMAFAYVVGEVSYQLGRSDSDRQPRQIEILIPPGTAEAIANGQPGPGMPDMRFFEDDQILVRNMDSVSHQLGPLWIPPNASSVLTLDRPSSYSLSCSFQASQSVYIEVVARENPPTAFRDPVDWLPTWMLIWVYTLIGIPTNPLQSS